MKTFHIAMLLALVACGPESTSFRTTDASDPARPNAAMQLVTSAVRVDVWSNGGYIGSSDEPMTHIGFEIRNTSTLPVVFDSDALTLKVFGKGGVSLLPPRFVAVTPLGPAKLTVAPGETRAFDAYFLLPVQPRAVESMRTRWSVQIGNRSFPQTSSFVRDDDYPVVETPAPAST